MTPHHQPAAADPAEAAAPAAWLKPIMDRIDTKLAEILQEIAALKEIAGAPPRQRTSVLAARSAVHDCQGSNHEGRAGAGEASGASTSTGDLKS